MRLLALAVGRYKTFQDAPPTNWFSDYSIELSAVRHYFEIVRYNMSRVYRHLPSCTPVVEGQVWGSLLW